jgi:hypothetical protein
VTKIDGANALSLVPDPMWLKTRLNQLLQHATDPPVLGIQLHEYCNSNHSSEGFVVCYVPESSFKPHRAMRCTGEPYYIRINDRFVISPHPFLRYMFYPQYHVRFELRVAVKWEIVLDRIRVRLNGGLKNIGNRTAHDVVIYLATNPHFRLGGTSPGRLIDGSLPGWQAFDCTKPLHPGEFGRIFEGEVIVAPRTSINEHKVLDALPDLAGFQVSAQLYSADAEPQTCRVRFDEEEIERQETKSACSEVGVESAN